MNFKIFKNIFYNNILLLYELAKENPSNILSLKNNYNIQKKNLRENLNFLFKINFFKLVDDKIKINIIKDDMIIHQLIELILKDSEYGPCLKNYLINFKINESNIAIFSPSRSYNYETSDLRDFLITLGYVKNNNREFYLLKPEILFKFKKRKFSPEELEKELLNQKKLGLAAEKIILNNEIFILKSFGIEKEPIHVAREDVSLGYDILSFRKDNNLLKEIYIEVKAVSLSNYQFHLSTSEYQNAIKLNPNYFIYLLPVDRSLFDGFDLKSLLKINNIKENLFENKMEWSVESDGHLITKNNFND